MNSVDLQFIKAVHTMHRNLFPLTLCHTKMTAFSIHCRKEDIKLKFHTYAVTATSTISGCKINTASKSAGAICNRSYAIYKNIHSSTTHANWLKVNDNVKTTYPPCEWICNI